MHKPTSGNPILPDFCADPSAHEWDGRYWIYPSTDEAGSTSWEEMKRWHCYSSTDLLQWHDHGEIFSLEKVSWASRAAFAPDCMKRRGRYFFYFPADFQIGVAVADFPDGPFVDALNRPLITGDDGRRCGTRAMDPCVFMDGEQAYLFFSGGKHVGMAMLNDDMISLKTPPATVNIEHCAEGVWVHKYRGMYYFTYPRHRRDERGGITQDLVYSTAGSIRGPYTYQGTFMPTKERNIQHSIVEFDGQWFIFYHVEGPSAYQRRVCVEYLSYDSKGRISPVGMSTAGVQAIAPPKAHPRPDA